MNPIHRPIYRLLLAVLPALTCLLLLASPVYADDCLTDPWNAKDCMRTPGYKQFITTLAVALGVTEIALINMLAPFWQTLKMIDDTGKTAENVFNQLVQPFVKSSMKKGAEDLATNTADIIQSLEPPPPPPVLTPAVTPPSPPPARAPAGQWVSVDTIKSVSEAENYLKRQGVYDDFINLNGNDPDYWQKLDDIMNRGKFKGLATDYAADGSLKTRLEGEVPHKDIHIIIEEQIEAPVQAPESTQPVEEVTQPEPESEESPVTDKETPTKKQSKPVVEKPHTPEEKKEEPPGPSSGAPFGLDLSPMEEMLKKVPPAGPSSPAPFGLDQKALQDYLKTLPPAGPSGPASPGGIDLTPLLKNLPELILSQINPVLVGNYLLGKDVIQFLGDISKLPSGLGSSLADILIQGVMPSNPLNVYNGVKLAQELYNDASRLARVVDRAGNLVSKLPESLMKAADIENKLLRVAFDGVQSTLKDKILDYSLDKAGKLLISGADALKEKAVNYSIEKGTKLVIDAVTKNPQIAHKAIDQFNTNFTGVRDQPALSNGARAAVSEAFKIIQAPDTPLENSYWDMFKNWLSSDLPPGSSVPTGTSY
jgi:hypothetical protein